MKKYSDSISNLLKEYPQANLLQNTCDNPQITSAVLAAGYSIYILRDDLTGFALVETNQKTGLPCWRCGRQESRHPRDDESHQFQQKCCGSSKSMRT